MKERMRYKEGRLRQEVMSKPYHHVLRTMKVHFSSSKHPIEEDSWNRSVSELYDKIIRPIYQ